MKKYEKPTAEFIIFDISTLITADIISGNMGWEEDE